MLRLGCIALATIVLLAGCGGDESSDDDAGPSEMLEDDDAGDDADDDIDDDVDDDADDDIDDDIDDDADDDIDDDVDDDADDDMDDDVDDDIDDDVDDDTVFEEVPGRYVIVAMDAVVDELDDLAQHRTDQGYTVETVTVEELLAASTAEAVEEAILDYLAGSYTSAQPNSMPMLLLVGDYNDIPAPELWTDPSDPNEYKTPSDLYYADIDQDWDADGDDMPGEWGEDVFEYNPEYIVGRLPSSNADEVSFQVEKILAFETDADSAYKWETLLIASYIMLDGDAAIIMNMIGDGVLEPAGYATTRMYEAGGPFPGDMVLTHESLLEEWGTQPYGLAFMASHGSGDGSWYLDRDDADDVGAGEVSVVWSSACSPVDPDYDPSFGTAMMRVGPAANFIGSTATTDPGYLGEGSLVFMVMTDRFMVRGEPVGYGVHHSKQLYLEYYWGLPYPRGMLLRNYFGISNLGDPAMTYWPRPCDVRAANASERVRGVGDK